MTEFPATENTVFPRPTKVVIEPVEYEIVLDPPEPTIT